MSDAEKRVSARRYELSGAFASQARGVSPNAVACGEPAFARWDRIAADDVATEAPDADVPLCGPRAEQRALLHLCHPAIPTPLGLIYTGTSVVAFSEFRQGVPLLDAGLGIEEVERAMSALLDALAHVWAAQIAHGDLKPGNVLITPTGAVSIIDWESAGRLGQPRAVGTVGFVPPWRGRAGAVHDVLDDQYALACTASMLVHAAGLGDASDWTPPAKFAERHPEAPGALHGLFAAVDARERLEWEQTTPALRADDAVLRAAAVTLARTSIENAGVLSPSIRVESWSAELRGRLPWAVAALLAVYRGRNVDLAGDSVEGVELIWRGAEASAPQSLVLAPAAHVLVEGELQRASGGDHDVCLIVLQPDDTLEARCEFVRTVRAALRPMLSGDDSHVLPIAASRKIAIRDAVMLDPTRRLSDSEQAGRSIASREHFADLAASVHETSR